MLPGKNILAHIASRDTGQNFVKVIWECLGFQSMALDPQVEICMMERDLRPG